MNFYYQRKQSKKHMNETRVHAYMQSQIGKIAYETEWWIQIDKEDFMHDINQCEFKMDGQDEGRDG